MTPAEVKQQNALRRRVAAALVYEAKLKEHEAAAWLGLGGNIADARATVHSALDAVLDAVENQIETIKQGSAV